MNAQLREQIRLKVTNVLTSFSELAKVVPAGPTWILSSFAARNVDLSGDR